MAIEKVININVKEKGVESTTKKVKDLNTSLKATENQVESTSQKMTSHI